MNMTRPALLLLFLLTAYTGFSQGESKLRLKRIYFNLYTDSIKTILNYYVNVEGEYSNGRVLPMNTADVRIIADRGTMSGNEWVAPREIDFEKVTFHAISLDDARINDRVTVWLKRAKDPRDEMKGNEMDLPEVPKEYRRGRDGRK